MRPFAIREIGVLGLRTVFKYYVVCLTRELLFMKPACGALGATSVMNLVVGAEAIGCVDCLTQKFIGCGVGYTV